MEIAGEYFLICLGILLLIMMSVIVLGFLYYVVSEISKDKDDKKDNGFNKPLFITMGIVVVVLTVVSLIFKSFNILAVSNGIQCIFVLIMLYMIYKDNKKG